MYVIELDRPWVGTPFQFQGFYLISQDQIDSLRHVPASTSTSTPTATREPRTSARRPRRCRARRSTRMRRRSRTSSHRRTSRFETCKDAVRDALDSLKRDAKMDSAKLTAASADMTESMERNPNAMLLLSSLQAKGSYELRRAIDSSVLMIAFGRFLQFARDRLQLLGLAGMLLDVGKTNIPDESSTRRAR